MKKLEPILNKSLMWIFIGLALFFACNLMYSAWCAFTWGKFSLYDYGIYTNMIWNSAHGEPFKVLVNRSYLTTHLSFSLALLGAFFRMFDHPFLLSFLQWSMIMGGGAFLVAAARKAKVPGVMAASLVLFWVGYKFTQGVGLSEFHGVCAYFLLVPWLYYECSFRKRMAWLPLILTLGVREEACILILPMLIYFSIKDRWKGGYILCAAAVAYGLLAVFYLYPLINGITLFERRGGALRASSGGWLNERRLFSMLWTFLPILALAHRKIIPAIIFPLTALLTVLMSGYSTQQSMGSHYGANVVVCLGLGLLEVMVLRARDGCFSGRGKYDLILRSFLLAVVTLSFHFYAGFLFLGGKNGEIYSTQRLKGKVAMVAAKHLPKDGVLAADLALVGYCANRSDVMSWSRIKPDRSHLDVGFTEADTLKIKYDGKVWGWLERGEWGVSYFDDQFVIMQRGYDTSANEELLAKLNEGGVILLPLTPKHAGEDVSIKKGRWNRTWCGKGYRTPVTLSYGGYRVLSPGKYTARFKYRAETPERICRGSWGEFSVHVLNDQGPPLAEASINQTPSPEGEYMTQDIAFNVGFESNIEVRVTGGDARLWLDRMTFMRLDAK